ncbi:hypothetical protein [Streptomyces angustmyceticus]|uniref:hypothetical protein n=1 Tax=Streptomyces angustmyceticus TaxID=285578 RepID=UPI00344B3324
MPPIWRDALVFHRAASSWRARQALSGTRQDLLRKSWWHSPYDVTKWPPQGAGTTSPIALSFAYNGKGFD